VIIWRTSFSRGRGRGGGDEKQAEALSNSRIMQQFISQEHIQFFKKIIRALFHQPFQIICSFVAAVQYFLGTDAREWRGGAREHGPTQAWRQSTFVIPLFSPAVHVGRIVFGWNGGVDRSSMAATFTIKASLVSTSVLGASLRAHSSNSVFTRIQV
jgi:hypothetical protein